MKVKFLGIRSPQKSTGCSVCGNKRVRKDNLSYTHHMVFPNGKVQIFRVGQIYEVCNENEMQFLLNFSYSLDREMIHPFVKV